MARRYARAAVTRAIGCLLIVLATLAAAASAAPAASQAPLLVVSSDYTKWSDDHVFTYATSRPSHLLALALGTAGVASPDGRMVAFVRGGEVWTVGANGRGARRVGVLDGDLWFGRGPVWSGDGRHIAVPVTNRVTGLVHTQLVDVSTGTVASADAPGAGFSPDGSHVAFIGAGGLQVADATGENARLVGPGWVDAGGAVAWSPDGRWIAFLGSDSKGMPWVVVVHPDGSALRELPPGGPGFPGGLAWFSDGRLAWLASPLVRVATPEGPVRTLARVRGIGWPEPSLAWSNDGRLIAIRSRGGAIDLISTATGRISATLHPPAPAQALYGGVSWLGTRLVLTAHKARSDFELELVHADGTGLRILTHNGFGDRDPSWAPDGRTIAFARTGERRHGLYTIGVAGGTVRRLTDSEDRAPAYSPDGTTIAFARGASIELLDLRTRKTKDLATTRIVPRQLSWTSDGRSIVFSDNYALKRLDVATGTVVTIDDGGGGLRPVVSPQGTRIAFLDFRDERYYRDPDAWGIFVSALDGTGVRRVTANDKFGPRSWSPDERLLAASDGYRLELVDVATGDRQFLLGSARTESAAFRP